MLRTVGDTIRMRRLTAAIATVCVLLVSSAGALVVRARHAALIELEGRGLDRAATVAIAGRRARDDGVLERIAEELAIPPVRDACIYRPDATPLCPRPPVEPARARTSVRRVVATGGYHIEDRRSLWSGGTVELWYPLEAQAFAQPGGAPEPQAPPARRVLLLVLDASGGAPFVRDALVHLALVGLAVIVLLGLAMRHMRLVRHEQESERALARERHFAALGRLGAVVAHEVRNPLGAIKGFAQLAAARFSEDDPAHGDMETIIEECNRLDRLVGSLLAYARTPAPVPARVDVRTVVERAVQLARPRAEEAHVALTHQAPAEPVVGSVDAEQLTQAVLNVLINGIEAAAPGGRVEVYLALTSRGKFSVWVDDSGPGFPEHLREVAFEAFVTSKVQGTGLGLAITRRIVEAHGGTLSLETAPLGGARVRITLPRKPPR